MLQEIFSEEARRLIAEARKPRTKSVSVGGHAVSIPCPFPSPVDWRDCWIYFLMLDRFHNPEKSPNVAWNQKYGLRQGGTFEGVRAQLDYLAELGVGAIWLSPVVKAPAVDGDFAYPGYSAQDFVNVDPRFASDGTAATAERELSALVDEAHARGIYVILDIVLNHSGRVFDYFRDGHAEKDFRDADVLNGPLGSEPDIVWRNGLGQNRLDWRNSLPSQVGPDDAVWPKELQRADFFRRRGEKVTDDAGDSFVRGDFGNMRQLVVEYRGGEGLPESYGSAPVLNILIHCYRTLLAKYDFDGFRIDTVKYVDPDAVEVFGNAMREFALSLGKKNFFTFGEIWDNEKTIARFVGRNSDVEGYGIDAALDFPLFFQLPGVCRGEIGVEAINGLYQDRKKQSEGLLSSHGEAGRFFVTFLDNHDRHSRFLRPGEPEHMTGLGVGVLMSLLGIPTLYYGTEQGLTGTTDGLDSFESVREALWGHGFGRNQYFYRTVKKMASVRAAHPALRYGRIYFREVSGNQRDFGFSRGPKGILAFSRILADQEVLSVANTNPGQAFRGWIVLGNDNNRGRKFQVAFSNVGSVAQGPATPISPVIFHSEARTVTGSAMALFVDLQPSEIQIWTKLEG